MGGLIVHTQRECVLQRIFQMLIVATVVVFGLLGEPQEAAAKHEGTVMAGISAGILAINLVSIGSSSLHLSGKKHLPLGWQIYGGVTSGLTLAFGGILVIPNPTFWVAWTAIGVGAITMTLTILASTRNRPKKPTVTLSPILLKDVSGSLTPGVGLSLLSF